MSLLLNQPAIHQERALRRGWQREEPVGREEGAPLTRRPVEALRAASFKTHKHLVLREDIILLLPSQTDENSRNPLQSLHFCDSRIGPDT